MEILLVSLFSIPFSFSIVYCGHHSRLPCFGLLVTLPPLLAYGWVSDMGPSCPAPSPTADLGALGLIRFYRGSQWLFRIGSHLEPFCPSLRLESVRRYHMGERSVFKAGRERPFWIPVTYQALCGAVSIPTSLLGDTACWGSHTLSERPNQVFAFSLVSKPLASPLHRTPRTPDPDQSLVLSADSPAIKHIVWKYCMAPNILCLEEHKGKIGKIWEISLSPTGSKQDLVNTDNLNRFLGSFWRRIVWDQCYSLNFVPTLLNFRFGKES